MNKILMTALFAGTMLINDGFSERSTNRNNTSTHKIASAHQMACTQPTLQCNTTLSAHPIQKNTANKVLANYKFFKTYLNENQDALKNYLMNDQELLKNVDFANAFFNTNQEALQYYLMTNDQELLKDENFANAFFNENQEALQKYLTDNKENIINTLLKDKNFIKTLSKNVDFVKAFFNKNQDALKNYLMNDQELLKDENFANAFFNKNQDALKNYLKNHSSLTSNTRKNARRFGEIIGSVGTVLFGYLAQGIWQFMEIHK